MIADCINCQHYAKDDKHICLDKGVTMKTPYYFKTENNGNCNYLPWTKKKRVTLDDFVEIGIVEVQTK